MEFITVDLTGFDLFLYSLAIALPILIRHPIQSKKVEVSKIQYETLEDLDQDYSFAKGLESYGIKFQVNPTIAQPEVDMTSSLPEYEDSEIVGKPEVIPTSAKSMAIARQSVLTVIGIDPVEQSKTDFESLSVAQLKQLWKDLGYTGYSRLKRAELIDRLKASQDNK